MGCSPMMGRYRRAGTMMGRDGCSACHPALMDGVKMAQAGTVGIARAGSPDKETLNETCGFLMMYGMCG